MYANTALTHPSDPGRSPITISTTVHNRVTIVSVLGEIDLLTIDQFRNAIEKTFDFGPPDLLVDLSQTTFLASVGVQVLEYAHQRAERAGKHFALVTKRPATTCPIVALHLEKELNLQGTVDEVLEMWIRPDVRWPEPSPLDSWWTEVMKAQPTTGPVTDRSG